MGRLLAAAGLLFPLCLVAHGQGKVWRVEGGVQAGVLWNLRLDGTGTVLASEEVQGQMFLASTPSRFAGAVGGLGDWDGDGVPDLVVGSPRSSVELGILLL
ncbi:MAG TPA: hypothetical protein ENJ09_09845, partial [Planctomycetes bacterium]|nr:hypothetical protein [Planctomycetota bacterium]